MHVFLSAKTKFLLETAKFTRDKSSKSNKTKEIKPESVYSTLNTLIYVHDMI